MAFSGLLKGSLSHPEVNGLEHSTEIKQISVLYSSRLAVKADRKESTLTLTDPAFDL